MGAAIRAFNWAQTPLGPLSEWPPVLSIAVGMMVNSRFPKCIVWGPEYTTLYNDAFRPILGDKPEALGRSFRDIWAEAWDTIGPIAEQAYSGEATFIEDFPLVIDRFGHPEQAYFTFCYSPIRDENGRVGGMMDTVVETTGKVRAEEHSQLLNRELAHRVNNTLATVSAIANQTFRNAETKEAAQAVFGQRLRALAGANRILTQSHVGTAMLADVIASALAPHETGIEQIAVSGPPVELSARQALGMSLAIHELATNAVKYGALSEQSGRVEVAWESGHPGTDAPFRFRWAERGGPPVAPPERRGFGSVLIERILPQDFNGTARLEFEADGLRFALETQMQFLAVDIPKDPGADTGG